MKIRLHFPPVADPTLPPHGLARLTGHLRSQGHDVRQLDGNLRFFLGVLHREVLQRALEQLEEELRALERALSAAPRPSSAPSQQARYQRLARCLLCGPAVLHGVQDALAVMRQRSRFDDLQDYAQAAHILRLALEILSARHAPLALRFHGLQLGERLSVALLQRQLAAGSAARSLFDEAIRAELERSLEDGAPDLLGISVMFADQLLPALLLAPPCNARAPGCCVCLGGTYPSHLGPRAAELLRAFPSLDVVVAGPGEGALDELLSELGQGQAPHGLRAAGPPPSHEAMPVFERRDLPRYLCPEPVLPTMASRGCYWGRCRYCAHHGRTAFQPRRAEEVFQELQELGRRYGARCFYLTDDSLSPAFLRRFGRLLLGLSVEARPAWYGDARPEDLDQAGLVSELARAGLAMLFLGVESGDEQLRNAMGRGGDLAAVTRCVERCHRAGIPLKLNFILCYPGETPAQRRRSLALAARLRRRADLLAIFPFNLPAGSPLQAGEAGLQVEDKPPGDLSLDHEFRTDDGLTAQTAAQLWHAALQAEPQLRLSTWQTDELSRSHRVLHRHLLQAQDFEASAPIPLPRWPQPGTAAWRDWAADDPLLQAPAWLRARPFLFNPSRPDQAHPAPVPALSNEPLAPQLRGPSPTVLGLRPALQALLAGPLRRGMALSELVAALEDMGEGEGLLHLLLDRGFVQPADQRRCATRPP